MWALQIKQKMRKIILPFVTECHPAVPNLNLIFGPENKFNCVIIVTNQNFNSEKY